MIKVAYRRVPHLGHPEHDPNTYEELKKYTKKHFQIGKIVENYGGCNKFKIIDIIEHKEYRQTKLELILVP